MKTARFSRLACWPMNSARICGRRRRLGGVLLGADRGGDAVVASGSAAAAAPRSAHRASSFRLSRIRPSSAAPLAHARPGPLHRRLRLGPPLAEVDQRGERIRLAAAAPAAAATARRCRSASRRPCRRNSVSSRQRQLGAHARRAASGWRGRRPRSRRPARAATAPRARPAPPSAPTPCTSSSGAEPVALGRIGEAEQHDGVLAHLGLDQQPRRGRRRAAGRRACASRLDADSRRRRRRARSARPPAPRAAGELRDHAAASRPRPAGEARAVMRVADRDRQRIGRIGAAQRRPRQQPAHHRLAPAPCRRRRCRPPPA